MTFYIQSIYMKKALRTAGIFIPIIILFTACSTLSGLPTNTTGGVFSLNGSWKMTSTTEGNAMNGTVINVLPVISDGNVTSLQNNTYCVRVGDAMWKNIKSASTGGFNLNNLVGACDGSPEYTSATLTVINNNEVKLNGQTRKKETLTQTWKRITK